MFNKIIILLLNFNRSRLIKISLLILLGSILEILAFGSIIPLTLVLVDNNSINDIEILKKIYFFFKFSSFDSFIVFLAFGILFFNCLLNFYHIISRYRIEKNVWEQYTFVSKFYLQNIFKKDLIDLESKNLSEYYSKILNELSVVFDIIILSIIDSLSKFFTIIFIISFLLIVNASITTIVIFFSLIIFLLIYKIVGKKLKELGSKLVIINQNRYDSLLQIFRSIKEIKLYKSNFFFKNYDVIFSQYKEVYLKSSKLKKISKHIVEPIFFAMIIFFLITGYFKLRNFDAILPIATTFIYAIIRILPASNALLYNVNNIKNFEPHLNRVFPEIEKIKYKKNITLNDTGDYFQVEENNNFQNLKLNNVRFIYPGRSNEFNFKLTIEQGKYYKIIGKNGSGKSTLIKILLGLIHPNSGEYIVNYKKLNKEEILNWQNQMAYVPQDVFLINNKVIDNIAYAVQKDKIDLSLAKNVLNIVENSVNEKDKLNLNLKIKDNGNNISGGQKQKIGIARALYLKKKILIFDESFSAIDFFTKDDIIKKLLKSNLTLIEITHDIKDIKDNENLIVLKDRNIFYQGTKKNFNDNLI